MLQTRVIPALLLHDGALVKSVQFRDAAYVGDPLNAVRIFNEFEVDELLLLDIAATATGKEPPFDLISAIAAECFMPLSYGGGISDIDHARRLFALGVEKVSVNSAALDDLPLLTAIATEFGSQSLIVSIDAKKPRFGGHKVYRDRGQVATKLTPEGLARQAVEAGAGEILVTSIDRDGTWQGYDLQLVQSVTDTVNVPVIANGGAGGISDLVEVVRLAGASAVAAGSMVVYQRKGLGVLINFPSRDKLDRAFNEA